MKLIITGNARHGKDTVCDILSSNYGYKFKSSSDYANEKIIFPALKDIYNYKTLEECFKDRINHRKEWFDLISGYNREDKTTLGREIFDNYDIYCGIRNIQEFQALKNANLFDYSIWVDASERVEAENAFSISIKAIDCDIILNNNGSLLELEQKVDDLINVLKQI